MFRSSVVFAVVVTVFLGIPAPLLAQDISSYPFSATLSESPLYQLYWSYDNAEESVSFLVRVETTGWVGLGLSPNGGMIGSDVVIGWVDDNSGDAFFHDRYAESQSLPPIDESQDWFLTKGVQENGFTILEFNRKWVTCDDKDRDIDAGTARVVFSSNPNDPPPGGNPAYHGTGRRGSVSLNLRGGQVDPPPTPSESFLITVSNVTIPGDRDTTYWCAVIELPEDIEADTVYVMKTQPQITDNGFQYVHHMILTLCADSFTEDQIGADKGSPCGSVDGSRLFQCGRSQSLGGWAVGGEGFTYPENVGLPVGGNEFKYVVAEMHYDNPNLDEGVVDSSGMRFFYTRNKPTYEAGSFAVGASVSPLSIIPPNQESFIIYGLCSMKCTDEHIPEEGINLFGNFFHTHLAGRELELELYRVNSQCDKDEELEPIEVNRQYDFNYQQTTFLPRERKLYPGDVLLLKCNYSTTDRDSVTLGGESTRQEMCISFLQYYPKTDLTFCVSFNNLLSFWTPEELQVLAELDILENPNSLQNISELIEAIKWDDARVQSLANAYKTEPNNVICDKRQNVDELFYIVPNQKLPEPECSYEAPDSCKMFEPTPCCERGEEGGTAGGVASANLVLLMGALAALLMALHVG